MTTFFRRARTARARARLRHGRFPAVVAGEDVRDLGSSSRRTLDRGSLRRRRTHCTAESLGRCDRSYVAVDERNLGIAPPSAGTHVSERRPWWCVAPGAARFRDRRLAHRVCLVATHNHFVLDRGGKVFKQTAPVIKLPTEATEDDHLALLGVLNSSTACFWLKQNSHNKGEWRRRGRRYRRRTLGASLRVHRHDPPGLPAAVVAACGARAQPGSTCSAGC